MAVLQYIIALWNNRIRSWFRSTDIRCFGIHWLNFGILIHVVHWGIQQWSTGRFKGGVPQQMLGFEFQVSMSWVVSVHFWFWRIRKKYAFIFCFVYKIKPFSSSHMVHTFQVNGRTVAKTLYLLQKVEYLLWKTAYPPKNCKLAQALTQPSHWYIAITHTQAEAKDTWFKGATWLLPCRKLFMCLIKMALLLQDVFI